MWQFSSGLFAGIIVGSAGTVAYAMKSREIREFLVDVAAKKIDQILFSARQTSSTNERSARTRRILGRKS